jgi:hypothetical protein
MIFDLHSVDQRVDLNDHKRLKGFEPVILLINRFLILSLLLNIKDVQHNGLQKIIREAPANQGGVMPRVIWPN